MTKINRQWLLAQRPKGLPSELDFEYREVELNPPTLKSGEILIRNHALLCAPTIRNWMEAPGNNLYPSIALGSAILGPATGEVIQSANPDFPEGTRICCLSSWQDYEVIKPNHRMVWQLRQHHSYREALGVYGLNAFTGYFGMLEVGQAKEGDAVLVSGAAGSAGSIAAQVAKIKGCRVVGIAGGKDKCRWLTEECGLNDCIDYKAEDVGERVKALFPEGINLYFDNVGGEILQTAIENMAMAGRIVLCGQIANYNEDDTPEGPRNMMRLVYGGMRMEGFITAKYFPQFQNAIDDLEQWVTEGKLKHREDVRDGFESLPRVFNDLFSGANNGTLMVNIAT